MNPTSGSTFVPIAPCRLFDTRRAPDTVGLRSAPLGARDVHTQQVTGSNGECDGIPTVATAVSMNVTVVGGTADSYLTVYPADLATPPKASNLNWSAGAPPMPNKVDVKLSPSGQLRFFNLAGSVDVIADVVGYYAGDYLTREESTELFRNAQAGPIASGLTVTGYAELVEELPGIHRLIVQLPGTPPTPLTNATVNFSVDAAPAIDGDPACTGTTTDPTAPPGRLCLYLDDVRTGTTKLAGYAPFSTATRNFFVVGWIYDDGPSYVAFFWAYTAP